MEVYKNPNNNEVLVPGTLLEGRFQVVEILASNGVVTTYLAHNKGRRCTPPRAEVLGMLIASVLEKRGPRDIQSSFRRRAEKLLDQQTVTLIDFLPEKLAWPNDRLRLLYIAGELPIESRCAT